MPAAVELPPSAGQNHGVAVLTARPHGHFLAGEAGELAGVSGNTIGQWARWGYIRASQSGGDPHVYSVEDVAEAAAGWIASPGSRASATTAARAASSCSRRRASQVRCQAASPSSPRRSA